MSPLFFLKGGLYVHPFFLLKPQCLIINKLFCKILQKGIARYCDVEYDLGEGIKIMKKDDIMIIFGNRKGGVSCFNLTGIAELQGLDEELSEENDIKYGHSLDLDYAVENDLVEFIGEFN